MSFFFEREREKEKDKQGRQVVDEEKKKLNLFFFLKKKNFKTEKTWKVLEDAIHEINNHNASGLSFEELYR